MKRWNEQMSEEMWRTDVEFSLLGRLQKDSWTEGNYLEK
jgi:hypothetical protein